MGKTYRKSLHRTRYESFEAFFQGEYGDDVMRLAKYGRGFTKTCMRDIQRIWKRAGRDMQFGHCDQRMPRGGHICKDASKRAARHRTRQAIQRGMNGADWDEIHFPRRKDLLKHAYGDSFYW